MLATFACAQGSLTPPGAPAPTMKSLDQLDSKLDTANAKADEIDAKSEKRTPISSLPVTINEAGSYYFTGNLHFTAASGDAIKVLAPGVTIDLMGFTLSSAPEVTGSAINFNGENAQRGVVKNGSIVGASSVTRNNTGWTVTRGGFYSGVSDARLGQIAHLTIAKCRDAGISVADSRVEGCLARENGGNGIQVLNGGTIINSIATLNGNDGFFAGLAVVSNSTASNNQSAGIFAANITDSTARENGGTGLGGPGTETVANSSAADNRGYGIFSYAVTASIARGNSGTGIFAAHVQGCTAWENGLHGIHVRPPVLHSGSNGGAAIANVSSRNGRTGNGAGIYIEGNGTRVEGNNCHDNDWGIQSAAGSDAFIVRNSCRSNAMAPTNAGATSNFDFDRASNTYGPVITANSDMSANAATSHPAANIQF